LLNKIKKFFKITTTSIDKVNFILDNYNELNKKRKEIKNITINAFETSLYEHSNNISYISSFNKNNRMVIKNIDKTMFNKIKLNRWYVDMDGYLLSTSDPLVIELFNSYKNILLWYYEKRNITTSSIENYNIRKIKPYVHLIEKLIDDIYEVIIN